MLTAIIVGVGEWERYTKPLLDSIREHMPDMNVVVVDNGDHYPEYPGVQMVKTDTVISYPAAINLGLRKARTSEWYLILNNDILIEKPFTVDEFDRRSLYGLIMFPFREFQYLAGCALFIPYEALIDIGEFDEACTPMWFEDADYCIRATKANYDLVVLDRKELGIRHFEDENMDERKAYMNKNIVSRRRNRQYVERKHGY